jgi:hypothetical protein
MLPAIWKRAARVGEPTKESYGHSRHASARSERARGSQHVAYVDERRPAAPSYARTTAPCRPNRDPSTDESRRRRNTKAARSGLRTQGSGLHPTISPPIYYNDLRAAELPGTVEADTCVNPSARVSREYGDHRRLSPLRRGRWRLRSRGRHRWIVLGGQRRRLLRGLFLDHRRLERDAREPVEPRRQVPVPVAEQLHQRW